MIITEKASIYSLINVITHRLSATHDDMVLCKQYAWWLLETITHMPKTTLLMQESIALTNEQIEQLELWIKKHVQEHIPLQYLLGSVPFGNCSISVKPPILIPRTETEEWCYALIEQLQSVSLSSLRIVDLCTGTGCIAIALAQALPQTTIYATDISKEALALAQQNAHYNKINNIVFIESDLFNNLTGLTFDIIIANPPYISLDEWHTLDPAVRIWEDKRALIADDHGTAILQNIIKHSSEYLHLHPELIAHNIPQLIVEIGHKQGIFVKDLFDKAGFSKSIIKKDLYGNDRIVVGYKTHEIQS